MAQSSSEDIHLDCGCNKMLLTSKKYMINIKKVDREMTTANKGKLIIKGTGEVQATLKIFILPQQMRARHEKCNGQELYNNI